MSYVYFDIDGRLRETVSTPTRKGSEGVDRIFVYWEGVENSAKPLAPAQCTILYGKGDTTAGPLTATSVADSAIPFDKNRDLKFFEYGKSYRFIRFDLPAQVTSLDGYWSATVSIHDLTTKNVVQVLGDIAFEVEKSVIVPSGDLNLSQYNYLLEKVNGIATELGLSKVDGTTVIGNKARVEGPLDVEGDNMSLNDGGWATIPIRFKGSTGNYSGKYMFITDNTDWQTVFSGIILARNDYAKMSIYFISDRNGSLFGYVGGKYKINGQESSERGIVIDVLDSSLGLRFSDFYETVRGNGFTDLFDLREIGKRLPAEAYFQLVNTDQLEVNQGMGIGTYGDLHFGEVADEGSQNQFHAQLGLEEGDNTEYHTDGKFHISANFGDRSADFVLQLDNDGVGEAMLNGYALYTNFNTKSVLGKKLLEDGEGDINLYRHRITLNNGIHFEYVSTNNLICASVQDLRTVVRESASGYIGFGFGFDSATTSDGYDIFISSSSAAVTPFKDRSTSKNITIVSDTVTEA